MSIEEISRTLSLIPDHEDRAQGLTNLITSAIEVINVVELNENIQKEYKLKLVRYVPAKLCNDFHWLLLNLWFDCSLRYDVEENLRPQLRAAAESQSAQQQSYDEYKSRTHEVILSYAVSLRLEERHFFQYYDK